MTVEQLTTFAGVILALFFAYVPKVKDWYDARTSQQKALVMLVALFVVAGGAFGLTCGGFIAVGVVCTKQGLVELAQVFVFALIANQSTYLVAVRPFKITALPKGITWDK